MNPEGFSQKWPAVLAYLLVLPPWVWLAVRTNDCLGFVTGHRIPFSKRAIWLTKLLALILGAGGLAGALNEVTLPWFLALLPAGIVVLFALTERVEDVVPSEPVQNAAARQLSWNEYWKLRAAYTRSFRWIGMALISAILVFGFANKLPDMVGGIVRGLCFLVLVTSFFISGRRQLKFFRWPCPRCGCALSGWWHLRPFPKRCVFCGLQVQPPGGCNG